MQFVFTAPAIPSCIYELNQQYQWQNNSQMHVSLLYRHIWKQVAHYEMQAYRKCWRIDAQIHNSKPYFRNLLESNDLKNLWLMMNQLKDAAMQVASTRSALGRPPTHYFLFVKLYLHQTLRTAIHPSPSNGSFICCIVHIYSSAPTDPRIFDVYIFVRQIHLKEY